MERERGFRRLVNFSDAIVAIAITLLILPLVDAAGAIGNTSVNTFLRHNDVKLIAFALSFAVIGSFWWGQHRMLEGVRSFNGLLVAGMAVWILSIVFLPFPTELISSANNGIATAHAIYVGTMLLTAATLVQKWAIVRGPELGDDTDPPRTIDAEAILTGLMAFALVITIVVPSSGLWPLFALLLSRPLERTAAHLRGRRAIP